MTETTLSQSAICDLFASGADRLSAALEGFSETDLDCREAPGEWTVRQIIHHLADDGDAWSQCIKKAIATPGISVRFEGFPGNEPWANTLDFHVRPIDASLGLIHAHRRYITGLLDHFSSAWDHAIDIMDAKGTVVARVSVGDMAKMLANHFDEHLATIERIKARRS